MVQTTTREHAIVCHVADLFLHEWVKPPHHPSYTNEVTKTSDTHKSHEAISWLKKLKHGHPLTYNYTDWKKDTERFADEWLQASYYHINGQPNIEDVRMAYHSGEPIKTPSIKNDESMSRHIQPIHHSKKHRTSWFVPGNPDTTGGYFKHPNTPPTICILAGNISVYPEQIVWFIHRIRHAFTYIVYVPGTLETGRWLESWIANKRLHPTSNENDLLDARPLQVRKEEHPVYQALEQAELLAGTQVNSGPVWWCDGFEPITLNFSIEPNGSSFLSRLFANFFTDDLNTGSESNYVDEWSCRIAGDTGWYHTLDDRHYETETNDFLREVSIRRHINRTHQYAQEAYSKLSHHTHSSQDKHSDKQPNSQPPVDIYVTNTAPYLMNQDSLIIPRGLTMLHDDALNQSPKGTLTHPSYYFGSSQAPDGFRATYGIENPVITKAGPWYSQHLVAYDVAQGTHTKNAPHWVYGHSNDLYDRVRPSGVTPQETSKKTPQKTHLLWHHTNSAGYPHNIHPFEPQQPIRPLDSKKTKGASFHPRCRFEAFTIPLHPVYPN